MRDLRRIEIRRPGEVRRDLGQIGKRSLVILLFRIAQGDVVQRRFGQALFEREHGLRRLFRRRRLRAGKLEHLRHVRAVILARFDEAFFRLQVVVAVRHAEAAGDDIGDDLGRIVQILLAENAERHADADIMQFSDHALHVGLGLDRAHFVEQRLHRLDAELVDLRLVHARGVEVARQLLRTARGPVLARGHFGEDVAHVFLVDLAGFPAPAPPIHVIRDRMAPAPGAVRVVEEIGARCAVLVHIGRVDTVRGIYRNGGGGDARGQRATAQEAGHARGGTSADEV